MAVQRKDFDEIREKMGNKSAKEFVKASEKKQAVAKKMKSKRDNRMVEAILGGMTPKK